MDDALSKAELVLSAFRGEGYEFNPTDLARPFEELDVDSFGLIACRARLEQLTGAAISDEQWITASSPADLVAIVSRMNQAPSSRRVYRLNMPQMAMGGLSELWLFKEVGGVHWDMIAGC